MDTIRLAVLISGGGTTLQNLIDTIRDGNLNATIVVVVASRRDAGGIERARKHGIPTVVVARTDYSDVDRFNDALHATLDGYAFDLIVLGGFLSPLQLRGRYNRRVINVHPALIPAFSGKGFYGLKVHQAVIESGVKITGCTVHFADDEYDHGPIILQDAVHVRDDDTAESIAARVHEAEKRLYPEAIRLFASGRLVVSGRRVHILPRA
jgi:formyltetrahydrofolate-dependent phosphoribosylglycinamide formyltransferase